MSENFEYLVQELKSARENMKMYRDAQNKALEDFKASDDVYTYNRDMADGVVQLVSDLETAIREKAIEAYETSQNKSPHPKVTVKVFKSFNILEPAKVLAWVKTNLADALIFDEKKVKNYATKIGPIEGTELVDEPKALIATEL